MSRSLNRRSIQTCGSEYASPGRRNGDHTVECCCPSQGTRHVCAHLCGLFCNGAFERGLFEAVNAAADEGEKERDMVSQLGGRCGKV